MRRIIAIIGAGGSIAALSLLAATGAGASPAHPLSPAVHAAAAQTQYLLCSSKGDSFCLSAIGAATGDHVLTEYGGQSGYYQVIAVQSTTACGNGRVSQANNCPFDVGSGLNSHLDGDRIVTLKFVNAGVCVGIGSAANNSLFTFTRNCSSGYGRWWVKDGTYAYANVAGSDVNFELGFNYPSDEAYLHDSGGGHPNHIVEDAINFVEGADQWALVP